MTTLAKKTIGLLEHALAVDVGFVMMVLGLGMAVTIILLPFGLIIGLLGLALFVGGLSGEIDTRP